MIKIFFSTCKPFPIVNYANLKAFTLFNSNDYKFATELLSSFVEKIYTKVSQTVFVIEVEELTDIVMYLSSSCLDAMEFQNSKNSSTL